MEKKSSLKKDSLDQPDYQKKKATLITIIPIGIAYSEVNPKFRSNVSICFGDPLIFSDNINFSLNEFNEILHEKMTAAENKALKIVGR